MTYHDLLPRYDLLNDEITTIMQQHPLAAHKIMLLAVVKQQPLEKIKMLLAHGHRFFAENRVQEAASRWPDLKQDYPNVELHHIGTLQTNKARDAVALYDVIETLDRISLAKALNKEALTIGKIQRCMIQVNIGEEPQKGGVMPEELEAFIAQCQTYHNLAIEGLMCVPPIDVPPAPYFALLRKWQQRLELPYLSMGMSGDYAEAIRFGATHVRVGTKLMGEREG